MKKRVLSLFLAFCMITSLLPMQVFAANTSDPPFEVTQTEVNKQKTPVTNPFTDVSEKDWFYSFVMYALENGLFSGVSATSFAPQGSMTRGMYVAVMANIAEVDLSDYAGKSEFSDVPADHWAAPFVAWAKEQGITSGMGNGLFGVNVLITREQMAVMTVAFFEKHGIPLPAQVKDTQPKDMDSVSVWAKDAVLKLWRCGLFSGDEKGSFNPQKNATRAEGAAFCCNADKTVEQWFVDTGVKDEVGGEKKDEVQKEEDKKPSANRPSGGSGNRPSGGSGSGSGSGDSGSSTTQYYEVKFALGDGSITTGVSLPEIKTYKSGTAISALPVPFLQNGVFLGWYRDAAMTQQVLSTDTVDRNMTLYAKMAAAEAITESRTPKYATVQTADTNYTFKVGAASEGAVKAALNIIDVTGSNAVIDYEISGTAPTFTIKPKAVPGKGESAEKTIGLEAGKTYKVTLAEDAAVTYVGQDASVRELNIITAKNEVQNLTLNDGVKFIPKSSVSNAPKLEGLFSVSMQSSAAAAIGEDPVQNAAAGASGETNIQKVDQTGTFESSETLAVGDIVAIYELPKNSQVSRSDIVSGEAEFEYVAYVEITGKNGTTYTYRTSDSEDVLFTPDVLPVSSSADKDGSSNNNSITVDASVLNFSDEKYAELGLDETTTVDEGDFIAFYEGTFNDDSNKNAVPTYVKVKTVTFDESNNQYTITYTEADQADVLASMDIYNKERHQFEMTEEETQQIAASIQEQAIESGFVEEAAAYLTALALETDGFQELAADTDFDLKGYTIVNEDGSPVTEDQLSLMAGGKVNYETDVSVKVNAGNGVLAHLKGDDGEGASGNGVRVELVLSLNVTIGESEKNQFKIDMQAVFEQEVLLSLTASGGAVWEWAWIIPYIADYNLNASFEVGTYTGIGVTAVAYTHDDSPDDPEDKPLISDDNVLDFIKKNSTVAENMINIGDEIQKLMEQKDTFFNQSWSNKDGDEEDEAVSVSSGSLVDLYSDMIENADESWIDIVRQEIFAQEGQVDPFHILVYGTSADFVVSANVYVTLGMTFTYEVAKQYNFSIMLFSKEATNEVVDLVESQYQFLFYVMGTLGIRAGIEFEVAVGLFSLKLDSVGITAEAGVYAQMWGYFYYSLTWSESGGKDSDCSGAMFIEMGAYLEITFKAQLLNSDKLTWEPTIYENQWPFFTAGKSMNVYAFAPLSIKEDEEENEAEDEARRTFQLQGGTTMTLPTYLFDMQALDLQSGDNYDGASSIVGDEANSVNMDSDAAAENGTYNEEHFYMELSNTDNFAYDPATNLITVTPGNAAEVSAELKITWDDGPLAFSSEAIERIVTITWKAPMENTRWLSFHTEGGMLNTGKNYMTGVVNPNGGYCEEIGELPTPTRAGYAFGGWYTDIGCTKLFTETHFNYDWPHGIDLYAKWTPKEDTPFTVEYYEEDELGNYALITDADRLREIDSNYNNWKGRTGASASEYFYKDCAAGSYPFTVPTGFGYVPSLSTDTNTWTQIRANGSTVLKVYFIREKFEVAYYYGNNPTTDEPFVRAALTYTVKYGAPINPPTLTIGGYDFVKYVNGDGTDAEIPAKMPNHDLEYTATWEPGTVSYRVEHYVEDASGNYRLHSAAYGTGETGSDVKDADFAALLLNRSGELNYLEAPTFSNERTIQADGSLVIRCSYPRVDRTVNFNKGTEDTVTDMPEAQTVRHGAKLEQGYNDPLRTGYVFDGWTYNGVKWDFSDPVTDNMTLTAAWKASTNVAYKVEHYKQTADGTGYDKLSDVGTYYGTTGETADITNLSFAMDLNGFELNTAKSTQTGIILADGSLVLKRYYDRLTYDISFNTGDGGSTVESMTGVRHGVMIYKPETDPTRTGYTFKYWSSNGTTEYTFTTMPIGNLTLHAVWEPITYTVKFNGNGGSGSMADLTVQYDAVAVLSNNVFTRAGYVFTGWNTQTDGSGITYANQATVQNWSATDGETITLYAQWKVQEFGITFEPNGGTCNEVNRPLNYGDEFGTLPEATKTGHTFLGWYYDNDNGEQATATDTMPAQAVTLTAKWQINTYTYQVEHWQESLTQSADNGRVLCDGVYYELAETNTGLSGEYNEYVTLENNVKTYEGFTHKTPVAAGNIPANNDMVLKVYYDRNTYTVTFYPKTSNETFTWNGPYLKEVQVKHGATVTAPTDVFTRAGYTLSGWETPTAVWDFAAPVIGSVNLYAKWTANTNTQYQIKYYFETFTDDSYEEDVSKYVNSTGTTFAEIKADTSAVEGFTLNTSKSTTSDYIKEDGSTVLKVYYDRNKYDLTFHDGSSDAENRTDVFYGAAIDIPVPSREGYTFGGWFEDSGFTGTAFAGTTMPDRDLTLYAKWDVIGGIQYTVEYYWQDVTGSDYTVETVTNTGSFGETVSAEESSKTGFVFNANHSGNVLSGSIPATSNTLVLKRYYDRKTYEVTFDLNGANGDAPDAQTVRYEGTATAPTGPYTRDGYTFGGWATTNGDTTAYDFGTAVKENLTLYAIWTASTAEYTVEYYLENLDGTYAIANELTYTGTGTVGDRAWGGDHTSRMTYEGYERPNFSIAEEVFSGNIAADGSLTLKIYFVRVRPILRWYGLAWASIPEGQVHTLGGSKAANSTEWIGGTVPYGTPIVAPLPVHKDDKVFTGWAAEIPATMPVVEANTNGQKILQFTAQWAEASKTQYTVTFGCKKNAEVKYPATLLINDDTTLQEVFDRVKYSVSLPTGYTVTGFEDENGDALQLTTVVTTNTTVYFTIAQNP